MIQLNKCRITVICDVYNVSNSVNCVYFDENVGRDENLIALANFDF